MIDLADDDKAKVRVQWKENRLRDGQRFVGLGFDDRCVRDKNSEALYPPLKLHPERYTRARQTVHSGGRCSAMSRMLWTRSLPRCQYDFPNSVLRPTRRPSPMPATKSSFPSVTRNALFLAPQTRLIVERILRQRSDKEAKNYYRDSSGGQKT